MLFPFGSRLAIPFSNFFGYLHEAVQSLIHAVSCGPQPHFLIFMLLLLGELRSLFDTYLYAFANNLLSQLNTQLDLRTL